MTSRFAIPTFSPTSRDDSADPLQKEESSGRPSQKRRVAVRTKQFALESYLETISDIFLILF